MNDFMLAILGAAAEFERELISERVRDGRAWAKRDGVKLGKRTSDKTKAQSRRVIELNKEGLSQGDLAENKPGSWNCLQHPQGEPANCQF